MIQCNTISKGYAIRSNPNAYAQFMSTGLTEIVESDVPLYDWRFVAMPDEDRPLNQKESFIGIDYKLRPYLVHDITQSPVENIIVFFRNFDIRGNPSTTENSINVHLYDKDGALKSTELVRVDSIIRMPGDLASDYPIGLTWKQDVLACELGRLGDDDLSKALTLYNTLDSDLDKLSLWRRMCSNNLPNANQHECAAMCNDNDMVGQYCALDLTANCKENFKKYPQACGCFVPKDVVQTYMKSITTNLPEDLKWFQTVIDISVPNLREIQCTYPPCINAEFKGKEVRCEGDYTSCFQQIDVDIGGAIKGGNIGLINDCIITIIKGKRIVNPDRDIDDEIEKEVVKKKKNKNIWIAVGVIGSIIIIAIIILIAVLTKGKKTQ